jgi:hypothetical protein
MWFIYENPWFLAIKNMGFQQLNRGDLPVKSWWFKH